MLVSKGVWQEVVKMQLTVENGSGNVALVFASAGGGWGSVGVGVLPPLEEFFGLVKEDLFLGRGRLC